MLLTAGEEPGFTPAPGIQTYALAGWAEAASLSSGDRHRLQTEGFVRAAVEQTSDAGDSGVSNVQEFTSPTGARAALSYDGAAKTELLRQPKNTRLEHFSVPAVPGAVGYALTGPGAPAATNVIWVEGRCELILGSQGSAPLDSRVGSGAAKIYRRTKGTCP
jgi:hypothetical protein